MKAVERDKLGEKQVYETNQIKLRRNLYDYSLISHRLLIYRLTASILISTRQTKRKSAS